MSRNRCETRCDCDKRLGPEECDRDDPTLLTLEQYFQAIAVRDGDVKYWEGKAFGYGYRDDLEKSRVMYYGQNGSVSNFPHSPTDIRVETPSFSIPPTLRYRFRRIECSCGCVYVGWYVAQPYLKGDKRKYDLYDSSFWSSFNDEPGEDDKPVIQEPDWEQDAKEMLQMGLPWSDE